MSNYYNAYGQAYNPYVQSSMGYNAYGQQRQTRSLAAQPQWQPQPRMLHHCLICHNAYDPADEESCRVEHAWDGGHPIEDLRPPQGYFQQVISSLCSCDAKHTVIQTPGDEDNDQHVYLPDHGARWCYKGRHTSDPAKAQRYMNGLTIAPCSSLNCADGTGRGPIRQQRLVDQALSASDEIPTTRSDAVCYYGKPYNNRTLRDKAQTKMQLCRARLNINYNE